jgi:hypothetical protein
VFNIKIDSIVFPGRIVTYDPATQMATVKISAERIYSNDDVDTQLETRAHIEFVPVHCGYGGGWAITFPIAPGDTCLLVFSQIGYDHWLWENKDVGGNLDNRPAPHLMRSFSQDDGFCIVGFNPVQKSIQDVSATDSQWRDPAGTQKISLNSDGSITVDSEVDVTITAPSMNLIGNVEITGTLGVSGNALLASDLGVTGATTGTGLGVFSGISVSTHTHGGVTPGQGVTGPPS